MQDYEDHDGIAQLAGKSRQESHFPEGKVDGRNSLPFLAPLSERVSRASSSAAKIKEKSSGKTGALIGGMDGTRTRDLLRDRQTL
jgi:alanine dehydrogenase